MPPKTLSAEPAIAKDVQTESTSPLKSLAYGVTGYSLAGVADSALSLLASRSEQKAQARLMRKQLELQSEQTKRQMSDERESYLRAGLSPALLAEGGFNPVAVDSPSPAMQNVSGKNPDSKALAENKILDNSLLEQKATIENIEAQTRGQNLKNDEQEIINDRMEDEDSSSDANFREYLREILPDLPKDSPFRKKMQERLDNPEIRFTSGSVSANADFVEFLRSRSALTGEKFENEVRNEVAQKMLNSEDVLSAKAVMPYIEFKRVNAQINEISEVIAKYASEIRLNDENTLVARQLRKKMAQEVALLAYELESKQLSDSRYLLKHGRGSDLAVNIGINGLEFAGDVAKVFIGAKGLAGASRFGSSTAQRSFDKLPKVSDISRGQKYSAKELSSIPLSKRREMASIEWRTFKYEHPSMSEKNLQRMHEKIGVKYGIFKNPQNRLR